MNYRSLQNINRDVLKWIDSLPSGLDLIVGIPRSGLLVASLLSFQTNIPMTDVEGLLERRVIEPGQRLQESRTEGLFDSYLKVLVVDDSVGQGRQMRKVKEVVEAADVPHEIFYGAVYVTCDCQDMVDFFFEVLPPPRVFEWNILNSSQLKRCCVDIDGVLCRDPSEKENDDGPRYELFLENVKPRIVPKKKIGWLVTSRLEKYRALTEKWLDKRSIKYEHLRMLDLPDKESRVKSQSHATHKAAVYEAVSASLFIESSSKQARQIADLTGKPVYCTETSEMISPHQATRINRRVWYLSKKALTNPKDLLCKIRKRFF